MRSIYNELENVATRSQWFKVYKLEHDIYALSLIHIQMCIRDRDSPVISLSCFRVKSLELRIALILCPIFCAKSVSYTHLDVYKRQKYNINYFAPVQAVTPMTTNLSETESAPGIKSGEIYPFNQLFSPLKINGLQLNNLCLLYTSRCV